MAVKIKEESSCYLNVPQFRPLASSHLVGCSELKQSIKIFNKVTEWLVYVE